MLSKLTNFGHTALLALVLGSFLIGLAFGRFTLPAKVVTKVEVKERVVTVTEKATRANVVTIHREISRPDGTKVVRTVTVDKSIFTENEKKDSAIDRTEEKRVERVLTQWSARALAGVNFQGGTSYGAGIERRILGPIFLGGFAMSNGNAGVSLSILF